MKIKKIMFTALCAFGFGMAATASAGTTYSGMHRCCKMLQSECLFQGGTPQACAAVYSNCMAGNYCIVP
jgi:hypothetical protein